jgi:D-lactate dehydrogenase
MTVGVIGTGKIGECFARIAAGFGTELLGWDIAENPACRELGMHYTELPELLSRADLISLHVPLVPATHHLIDTSALARMKNDAILINSSRGGLVDSNALVETLRAGRLSGVGLDVYEEETGVFFTDRSIQGITDDTLARLVTFPQVLVTSHQAYFTHTAVGQIIDSTARNIDDYAAGRTNENTLVPKA